MVNINRKKQQGQRNFLRLAKERGVNKFLAFLNSPPVYFTQNGLATNTGRGGTLNLKEEHYKNFARFLANVIKGVEKHDGIKFNYLCPFNEPDGHWNWIGPKQEGTPATNREIAREEAEEEAIRMLNVYGEFAEKYMAVPVVKGVKSANERFAGALDTYTIEAMMQDEK